MTVRVGTLSNAPRTLAWVAARMEMRHCLRADDVDSLLVFLGVRNVVFVGTSVGSERAVAQAGESDTVDSWFVTGESEAFVDAAAALLLGAALVLEQKWALRESSYSD